MMEDWAFENGGDITEFPLIDAMDKLELDLKEKALSIGVWIKNLTAEGNAIEVEKKSLHAREKAAKAKAERLKNYLQSVIPSGVKYSDPKCVIAWRPSKVVILDVDKEGLPEEYQNIKIEPDKTALKAAIKEAEKEEKEFTFAHIQSKQNIQIK